MLKAVISGKRQVNLVDVPRPRPIEDWALVKINAAPMCTEFKAYVKGQTVDVLGHEAAGEVVEIAQPGCVNVGDRVVVMPLYPCGKCWLCISGEYVYCENQYNFESFTGSPYGQSTYAQYILKPSWLLPKIPDDISYEKSSLACCGLGPSFGAFQQVNLNAFDTVLISGLGPVGLGAVINARYLGARVIGVEPHQYRARLAEEMGAEFVVHPGDKNALAKIKEICSGMGPDAAIDCSGVPAAHRLCIDAVRRKATVAFVGQCYQETSVCISRDLISKGLTLSGVWHYNISDFSKLMAVIRNCSFVDKFISHVIPLSRIQDAFELAASSEHAKIILRPWE